METLAITRLDLLRALISLSMLKASGHKTTTGPLEIQRKETVRAEENGAELRNGGKEENASWRQE